METKFKTENIIDSKKSSKYPWFFKTILKPGEKYSLKETEQLEQDSLKRKVSK